MACSFGSSSVTTLRRSEAMVLPHRPNRAPLKQALAHRKKLSPMHSVLPETHRPSQLNGLKRSVRAVGPPPRQHAALLGRKSHHGSSTAAKNAAAAPSSARPGLQLAPRGRGCGRPAAPRWPLFAALHLGQQRQVQLADGRVVLEHKADAVRSRARRRSAPACAGVLPAGHAPAALGGQLAADGGTGQCVCPALRAPRGLGGVEALCR